MSYTRSRVLPKPAGPFPTGNFDFMFGRTQQGTLMRLYYPSNEYANERPFTSWFPGYAYTKGMMKFVQASFPQVNEFLFNWNTKDAKIVSSYESPVADGKFPLIIFSHGLSAHRMMYSTVCNDLASHGFLVAAIEHRDESASATFTLSDLDEKVWIYYKSPEKGTKEYPLRHSQVNIRAAECIKALDVLEQLNRGEIQSNDLPSNIPLSNFKDKIDISNLVLAGHSFGGAATMLALSQDKRFKIGIPLDPWMFPIKGILSELPSSITQPMLIILTESFQNKPNFKAFYPFNVDRNTFITLKGSVHQNQSDSPFLFGPVGRLLTGSWSTLDRYLAMSLNNQLIINFICKHLGLQNITTVRNIANAHLYLQISLQLQSLTSVEAQDLLKTQDIGNKFHSQFRALVSFDTGHGLD